MSRRYQERVNRARLLMSVQGEFLEAAVSGVVAIFEGLVQPLNITEPAATHVYVFNNIFFTRTMDLRERVRYNRKKRSSKLVRRTTPSSDSLVAHAAQCCCFTIPLAFVSCFVFTLVRTSTTRLPT